MNWAWWDGKMPVEHYRYEHELDTEALAEAEVDAAGNAGAKSKAEKPER